MNWRSTIRILWLAAALCSSLLPTGGPPDDWEDYVIGSDVRLVLLDVSVKDHDGGFVTGLSRDNFTRTYRYEEVENSRSPWQKSLKIGDAGESACATIVGQ